MDTVQREQVEPAAARPLAAYAAERLLQVLPRMFKQMMLEAHEEMPETFGDMGESQFRLIHALNHGEFTMGELAERMKVRAPTISRMIDALVARGLVDRQPDGVDRRKVWLTLTPEGHCLAGAMERRFCHATARFLHQLDAQQLNVVVAACDVLDSLLGEGRARPGKDAIFHEEQ